MQPRDTYSEVVPKQLHDESAVFVRLFIQRVQLRYRFVKCLKTCKTALSDSALWIHFCLHRAYKLATLLFKFCDKSFQHFSFLPRNVKQSEHQITRWPVGKHKSSWGSRWKPRTTSLPCQSQVLKRQARSSYWRMIHTSLEVRFTRNT